MIEEIRDEGTLYALVIYSDYSPDGVEFFTPGEFSQQLGVMKRPSGHEIEPHYHKDVVREVERTQEVLVIREGKVRVDIYDDDEREIESLTLEDGDVILLAAGGHGFEMLEETEMVEVKQGPYAGEDDKVHITRSESGDT